MRRGGRSRFYGSCRLDRHCRLCGLAKVCGRDWPILCSKQDRLLSGCTVMPIYRFNTSMLLLGTSLAILMSAAGCVGPMACGPMGCSGPIVAAHGGCGHGCGDTCNGCGERYYDEWINHPPSCSDPCDSCGNYQGQSCHACRPILSGFKSIWGYRCDPPPVGCASAGCDNLGCQGGCEPRCGCESCDSSCGTCGGQPVEGEHYDVPNGMMMESAPMHAPHEMHYETPIQSQSGVSQQPRIVRSSAGVKPFQPQRTRQIFQARDPNSVRGTSAPRF